MDLSQIVSKPENTLAPKPYWQVQDEHSQFLAKNPDLVGKVGVNDFAEAMNQHTQSNAYSAGLGRDNTLRHVGGLFEYGMHHLGGTGGDNSGWDPGQQLKNVTEEGAQKVGLSQGTQEKLGGVAYGMPSLGGQMLIATGAQFAGIPFNATLGVLGGVDTYSETGSPLAAGISAAAPWAFGKAGSMVEQGALKYLGGSMRGLVADEAGGTLGQAATQLGARDASGELAQPIKDYLTQFTGTTFGQRLGGKLAGQAGMFAAGLGVEGAQDMAQGRSNEIPNMFTPGSLLATAFGQLLFAAVDAYHAHVGGKAVEQGIKGFQDQFKDKAAKVFEQQTGQKATDDQINAMLERAQGTTLSSKVDVNYRPMNTKDGDYNMFEATEHVKQAAGIAGSGHDQSIATVLRGINDQNEGLLGKAELVERAKNALSVTLNADKASLDRYGMSSQEQREVIGAETDPTIEKTKGREAEIVDKINKDPQLAALVDEIIPKTRPKFKSKEAKLGEFDQPSDRGSSAAKEGAGHLDEPTQTTERMLIGKGEVAEEDYAARNALEREYAKAKAKDPNFVPDQNWKDKLLGVIRKEMGYARTAWSRKRGVETTEGTFDSEVDARNAAAKAGELVDKENPATFTAEPRGDKWVVTKQAFLPTHSIEGEHERLQGEGEERETAENDSEGIHPQHLQKLGETPNSWAQALEPISAAFKALESIKDPALREGKRLGITQNIMDAFAALSPTKFEELLLNGRTETEGGQRRATIANKSILQARMVRYLQYLRDGGVVRLNTSEDEMGNVTSRVVGNKDEVSAQLEGLNDYMKAHDPNLGFAESAKFQNSRANGLNFFEQFRLVADYINKNFVDLRDVSRRMRGDMTLLPRGITEQNVDNIIVDPKVYKGIIGKKANFYNVPGIVEDGMITMFDKNMSPVRVSMQKDKSPLMTMINQAAKKELTVSAGSLVDYMEKYHGGELDPRVLQLLKKFTDPSNNFGRNMRVGFGVSKEDGQKGMYHYDTNSMTNTGIVLSPFTNDPSGRYWKLLDNPADMAPHLLHELSHAHTVFAYDTDPTIKAEVDRIHQYALEKHQTALDGAKLAGFTLPTLHGLSDPREMLATVFNEQPFRDFMGSIKDPFEPVNGQPSPTLFHRVLNVIKSIMSKWLKPDQQGSLLDRLQDVTMHTFQRQAEIAPKFGDFQGGEKDLYGAVNREIYKKGQSDIIQGKGIQPASKVGKYTPQYTWAKADPTHTPEELSQLQDIANRPKPTAPEEVGKAPSPQGEKVLEAQGVPTENEQGKTVPVGRIERVGDPQGKMIRKDGSVVVPKVEGTTLSSRLTPDRQNNLYYAFGNYSHFINEDANGDTLWAKPLSQRFFDRQFAPILDKVRTGMATDNGGEPIYGLSKNAISKLTEADVAKLPLPLVHQVTTSSFETMREAFVRQGYKPIDAEVLAQHGLTALGGLRDSEDSVMLFGTSPTAKDNQVLGQAMGVVQAKLWGFDHEGGVGFLTALNKGVESTIETTRHELLHTVQEHPAVKDKLNDLNQYFDALSPIARSAFLESLDNLTDDIRKTGGLSVNADTTANEFSAWLMGKIGDSIIPLPRVNASMTELMRFASPEVSSLLRTATIWRSNLAEGLHYAVEQKAQEAGIKESKLLNVLAATKEVFHQLAKSSLAVESDISAAMTMRNLFPDAYQNMLNNRNDVGKQWNTQKEFADATGTALDSQGYVLASRVSDAGKDALRTMGLLAPEKGGIENPSLWTKKIGQFAHMVQEHPALRPFYDALASAQGLARLSMIALKTAMLGSTDSVGLMDNTKVKQMNTFNTSARLQDVFSKVAYDMQTIGDKGTQAALDRVGGDWTQVPRQAGLSPRERDQMFDKYGVSQGDKAILHMVFEGTHNQMLAANSMIARDLVERVNKVAAMAIVRNTNLSSEQSREAAQLIHQSWEAQDAGDVNTALQLQGQFKQMVPDLKVQAAVFDMVRESRDNIKQQTAMMNAKEPYFMSARSPGRFSAFFKDKDGLVKHIYAKDADGLQKAMQAQGVNPQDPNTKITYPNDNTKGLSPDIVSRASEGFEKVKGRLQGLFGDEEGSRLAQYMDWVSDFQNEFESTSPLAMSKNRAATDPTHPDYNLRRDTLNMFEAHQNYIRSVVTASKNGQMKLEKELALADPILRSQPVLRNIMEDHLAGVLRPDTDLGRGIQLTNMVYFVSAAPVLAMIEPFQQLTAAVPQLIREGETISGAWKRIMGANGEFFKAKMNKGVYSDPDLQQAVSQARASGLIDRGIFSELDANHELQMTNRIRVSEGNKPLELFDIVKSRMWQMAQTLVRWHGIVPAYNSEVAFVAAYKMYRESGRTPEQAFADARLFKDTTMLGGGKVNRPGIFDGQQSDFSRTAAQTMWSLQSYAVSQMTLMGRLIKESLPGRGLSPAQTVQARKAAVSMMATQLTLAGALGMPFVGGGIAILQKMFPDLQVEKSVREFLAHITGDSDAHGGWLGAALTSGVPSTLSQAPDVGARMSLGGVLGVSPYNGFNLQNIFGPTASIAANAFKAIQQAPTNPMGSIHELMPRGFERMWTAFQQGSDFKDPNGRLLVNDLTPAEVVARAVGFTPARVGRLQTAERLAAQAMTANKATMGQFYGEQAELLKAGNGDQVRMNIVAQAKKFGLNPVSLANEVAAKFEQETMPVDTRGLGDRLDPQGTQVMQGQLGQQTPSAGSVERLGVRTQALQSMGAPLPQPQAFGHAQAIDHILQMYPFMTPQQASAMLQSRSAHAHSGFN